MTVTSQAKVFFAGFRARNAKENTISKIGKLFDVAGFSDLIGKEALTAIKVHFGEKGNDSYINPVFVRTVVDKVKRAGGLPFVTDSNTLYSGSRHNAVNHLQTALEHGFSYATVNAPLVIADGLRGKSFCPVFIEGKHFTTVKIADAIIEARAMIVMSHFKGHELSGFGGAIKNLAMGCAPSQGKCEQHASRFSVNKKQCIACGTCIDHCPQGAIFWEEDENRKCVSIDKERCIGCGDCLTVCASKAMEIDWRTEIGPFCERMAEYALGAVSGKTNHVGYFNFLMNITPDCDCVGWSDAPIVPDIGIAASTDPVALDMASYDLVNSQSGCAHSLLNTNLKPGQDKFKGVWSYTRGEIQLSHAEAIGLGTTQYDLVEIS